MKASPKIAKCLMVPKVSNAASAANGPNVLLPAQMAQLELASYPTVKEADRSVATINGAIVNCSNAKMVKNNPAKQPVVLVQRSVSKKNGKIVMLPNPNRRSAMVLTITAMAKLTKVAIVFTVDAAPAIAEPLVAPKMPMVHSLVWEYAEQVNNAVTKAFGAIA
jgi:hypothetical protein